MKSRAGGAVPKTGFLLPRAIVSGAFCWFGLVTASSAAGEEHVNWAVFAGVDHSDNIRRTPDAEESESVAQAGLTLDLQASRPRLDGSASANMHYREYLDNSFPGEVLGQFAGNLSLAAVPERFLWVAEDNFGQVANDPRQSDTPNNRQNLNYFSTGPNITLPLTGRTDLQIEGRWSTVSFEDSIADSKRYEGTASLARRLTEQTALSLNFSASKIDYDSASGGYKVHEGFLGYTTGGARTHLNANVGYSELQAQGRSQNSALLRFNLTRKVATRSELALDVGRQYSDSATVFRQGQEFAGVSPELSGAGSFSDPFRSDSAQLTWHTDARRATLSFYGEWRKEKHDVLSVLDRKVTGVGIDLSRRFTTRLSGRVHGTYRRDDSSSSNVDLKESGVGAGVGWSLGRSLSMQIDVTRYQGNSGVGDTRTYTENRGYATLSYSHGKN